MKKYLWEQLLEETDWESRYVLLIEFGKDLPKLDEKLKVEKYKVQGCQSRVWLISEHNLVTGAYHFKADSDSLLVKGLLAIILDVFEGKTAVEISHTSIEFIEKTGLSTNLSLVRQQGIRAVISKIKNLSNVV